jgi:hypothetical protein
MAAPLTWRNVDAPDFRGSMDGYRIAGQSFDRAFQGISQGLDKFDEYRRTQAENAVLNASTAFADPAALRDAIASGAVFNGVDRSLVGRAALGALDTRAGTLLQQAAGQQELNTAKQLDPLRVRQAGLNIDKTELDNRFGTATFDTRVNQLGANLQSTQANTAQTRQETDQRGRLFPGQLSLQGLQIDNATLGRDRGRYQFANEQEADAAAKEARGLISELSVGAAGPVDMQTILGTDRFRKLSPGAQAVVLQSIPNATGVQRALTAAAGPTVGGAFASNIPIPETHNYVQSILRNAGTVQGTNAEKAEQLLPHLIRQESGGRDNVTSPVGAQGRTQVMPATGVDPGFGVRPMQNQTPQEFERFGRDYLKAMLDRYDGDPAKALAAYNAGPGRVDNWTGGSANSREARTDAATLAAQAGRSGTNISVARGQTIDGTLIPGYREAADAREAPVDVARRLAKEKYPGVSEAELLTRVQETMARGRVNPTQAGLILADSAVGAGMLRRNLPSILGGYTVGVDPSAAASRADSARRGEVFDAAAADAQQGASQANIKAATDAANAALAAEQAAERRGTFSSEVMARYRADRVMAQEALKTLTARQQANPAQQPNFDRPAVAAQTGGTTPANPMLSRVAADDPANTAFGNPNPAPVATTVNGVSRPADQAQLPVFRTPNRASVDRVLSTAVSEAKQRGAPPASVIAAQYGIPVERLRAALEEASR